SGVRERRAGALLNPVGICSVERDSRGFSIGNCDIASCRDGVCSFSGGVNGRVTANRRRLRVQSLRVGKRNINPIAVTVNRRRARIAVSLTAFQRLGSGTLKRNRKRARIFNCDLEARGSTSDTRAKHGGGANGEERTRRRIATDGGNGLATFASCW